MAGHGYSTVRVTSQAFETDFVCIHRPVERIDREDGGPLRYRVRHRARIWRRGDRPRLDQQIVEGDPELAAD
jgi:alkaline phosphatase D